jgi:hypothetical protein
LLLSHTSQDNLYGTSVKSVREPSIAGKTVVLDTQLKAVNLLQSFADIHPIVILLKPSNIENFAANVQEPLSSEVAQAQYQALMRLAADNDHVFTDIVELGSTFEDSVARLAAAFSNAAETPYWVNTFVSLPLGTPESSKIDRSETFKEAVEAPKPPRASLTAPKMIVPLSGASSSIHPRTVIVRRNDKNSFGFSVYGGVEDDLLPSIKLREDMQVVVFVSSFTLGFVSSLSSVLRESL